MAQNEKITHEVFTNLLYLSRLSLNDGDMEAIAGQVSQIVDYFDILKKFDTSIKAGDTTEAAGQMVRSDTIAAGIPQSALKQMTAEYMDGYFRVPKVLGSGV